MKVSKKHKNGIIQLSFLIIVFTTLTYLSSALPTHSNQFVVDSKIELVLNEQKCNIENNNIKKVYVNTISDYSGYMLGLNINQIDTLLSFLNKGNLIYNLEEFTRITSLSKKQLQHISTRLKFPKKKSYTSKNNSVTNRKKLKNSFQASKKFNINTITASQLKSDLKLPKFIADRIVKYRRFLKGYKNMEQIENVYSILPYQVNRIKENCYLK